MNTEADYVDFELSIQKAGENEYRVHAQSGDGEAEASFTIPFNQDKRDLIGATLTKVALRSSAKVRSSSAPEVKKMKEVGSTLFEQAMTGQVREFYQKCQGQADQQGKGIRWRLALDPSVGDLPWEFLYMQDEFLALNPRSPIVRYIKGAARVAPLKAEHPLRVLVVIASPSDETPLDTSAEKARITAALQPLVARGLVDVTFIEGPDTWERLLDTLLPNQTHILHFIGHGAFDEKNKEGVLVMEDADGQAIRIDSERLRVLVQGKSRLRLVVLNSCLGTQGDEAQPFSSMAAGLVRSGVPAVIAMQFEISDNAAKEIAETFYTSLALNMPVDAAVTEARRKIFLSDRDSLEWATPILFMQVPDGRLFQFELDKEKPGGGPTVQPGSIQAKAAKRYQDGDEAMAKGNWGDAVKAFRGVLFLVPGYRDATHKLTVCEGRDKAVNCYKQAKQLCDDKNYAQALQALAEARKLDPSLVDEADIQSYAECGQKYHRALGELQAGNQQRGAELLREVINSRDDFEDAMKRLDNLVDGGDGLLGQSGHGGQVETFNPPPIRPETPPQPPSPTEENLDTRLYECANPDVSRMAEELRQYFFTMGHESQIIQQGNVWVVQGQKTGGWRKWVGMSLAATVKIETTSNGMKVSVGGGKWMEQGAAMAISMLVLWPLLFTGGFGMAQQKQLIDTLWRMSDNYVLTRGGRRIG